MSAAETLQHGVVETGAAEKKWRRRSLWALTILLPAAIAFSGYDQVSLLLRGNDLIARDAKVGTDVTFGGSDWRLEAMSTLNDTSSLRLPEGAVPIFVDYTVKVGDPDLERLWMGCRITLVDAGGRSWLPTSVRLLPSSDEQMTCNSAVFSGAKTGDTLKIREAFLVPEDAVATIRPTLGLGSERPYYLRYLRPSG
ncbi:hypothetical protein [Aquamicrobium sp. LC103]|uniref:hypothetical protein n=1 Tax=Aquamicrobium sp. LC103 TaxID=1120658 RepID=UPI00063E9AB1|nr:hypothetical protein [Aquamicrobium sp. LC103]TKT69693.1 hypothetical protein XW59_026520 [Aquamicrobium sp. LC103]